jgi:hypothetical protein
VPEGAGPAGTLNDQRFTSAAGALEASRVVTRRIGDRQFMRLFWETEA